MKMNKILLSLTVALACAFPMGLQAQNFGAIHGQIFADQDVPLAGASILVTSGDDTNHGTFTDVDGNFVVKPLRPGFYNVEISSIGFTGQIVQEVYVKPEAIVYIQDVQLDFAMVDLGEGEKGPVIIAFRKKLIDPEETSKITMLAADIEKSPLLRDPARLLTTLNPEIKIDKDTRQITFRGARAGTSIFFVDGVKTRDMPNVPSSGIGSYTMYSGGIPAKYGDTTGGVVIIETKSFIDLYNRRRYQ